MGDLLVCMRWRRHRSIFRYLCQSVDGVETETIAMGWKAGEWTGIGFEAVRLMGKRQNQQQINQERRDGEGSVGMGLTGWAIRFSSRIPPSNNLRRFKHPPDPATTL